MTEPMQPLTGTKTFAGRWGPYILFAAGWYVLPPGRPRNLYLGSAAAIIGGFFVMEFHDTQPEEPTWINASPTIWSYLLWALGAWLLFELIGEVRAWRRWVRQQSQAPVAVAPLPETFVEDMNVPEPPFTAQVVETPRQAPPVTHRLWIPEPTRRVRRGGTTLSGVPIKDRRAVDPRTL